MNGERWTTEQANQWYSKTPWPVGCNFLPSTAINDVEMWQGESFDAPTIARELSWAASLGFNSVRVFLQYLCYESDPQGFLDRFEQVLSLCEQRKLSVLPIPFDDCCFAGCEPQLGDQQAPKPGVHNSGWVPSPGPAIGKDKANWPRLQKYISELLTRFGNDSRVIAWDLYNEPGANPEFDSTELLAATFDWARAAAPSQPLTVGIFKAKMDGTQTLEEIAAASEANRIQIEQSDILSFHNYCDMTWARGCVDVFSVADRPMLCTEWMARGPMESLFQTHLPFWKEKKIGCYNWGLVAGKTQTYYPWNNPHGPEEPKTWHHDILRADGTPFDPEEVQVIRECTENLS